jgi:ribonuclease I
VDSQETRKLSDIKGVPVKSAEVSVLHFITNPDDTEIELSPGTGIISYQYHHHGTVAETSLTLVEFHAETTLPTAPGAKP